MWCIALMRLKEDLQRFVMCGGNTSLLSRDTPSVLTASKSDIARLIVENKVKECGIAGVGINRSELPKTGFLVLWPNH